MKNLIGNRGSSPELAIIHAVRESIKRTENDSNFDWPVIDGITPQINEDETRAKYITDMVLFTSSDFEELDPAGQKVAFVIQLNQVNAAGQVKGRTYGYGDWRNGPQTATGDFISKFSVRSTMLNTNSAGKPQSKPVGETAERSFGMQFDTVEEAAEYAEQHLQKLRTRYTELRSK